MTEHVNHLTRRWFFRECGVGLGAMALGSLLNDPASAAVPDAALAPRKPQYAPRAKSVIFLHGQEGDERWGFEPRLRISAHATGVKGER